MQNKPDVIDDHLFEDDFSGGLNCTGVTPRWSLRPTAAGPSGDGLVTASESGLMVVPSGIDTNTGLPAFAMDDGRESGSGHLRWAAFANRYAGPGTMGFPLPQRGVMSARMTFSAELYNTADHPYGAELSDPDSSLKCGMAAMICIDMESGLVFDFALTNRRVWALYERLPRPGASHGTFSYAVPVAERKREDIHRCAINVDVVAGRARWSLDGTDVFAVEEIGRRLDSDDYLGRQTDGPEEQLAPRQISFGFGLFADPVWGQGMRLTARRADIITSSPAPA